MEQYLQLAILLFPGYVAKEIAYYLGDIGKRRKSSLEELFSYFLYSAFSLFPLMISWGMGMSLSGYFLLGLAGGLITGMIWALVGKKLVLKVINRINNRVSGADNAPGLSLIMKNMNDGEEHFIQLKKDGKVIATGFFAGITSPDEEEKQIQIINHPIYLEWLTNEKYRKYFPYLSSFVDLKNQFTLDEYSFPSCVNPMVLDPCSDEARKVLD